MVHHNKKVENQGCIYFDCRNEVDWIVVAYKITEEPFKQTLFKSCDAHMEDLKEMLKSEF